MYPHERPVEDTTICSILSRNNNEIYHLPFSAIKPYTNICWKCGHKVSSEDQVTCYICHWVSCPKCGACKQNVCSSDRILILDMLEENGWEEVTGYDMDSFFNIDINDKYHYLGQASAEEAERCYIALMQDDFVPIIIIDDVGILSLYINNTVAQQAELVIDSINGRLAYNLIDPSYPDFDSYSSRPSGPSCIFCGDSTYGDILCPSCANNID